MKKRTLLIAALILTLVLSACGGNSELEANRAKWDSAGVTHYRFKLTIGCFCPFMDIVPVAVEVQNGQVISMTDVNGRPLPADFRATFEQAGTVERLFAVAEENLANADQVEVKYDAQYGFPASIVADRIKLAADDEISYYVESFEALP